MHNYETENFRKQDLQEENKKLQKYIKRYIFFLNEKLFQCPAVKDFSQTFLDLFLMVKLFAL